MARARNIKPSFFKNDVLVELPYETRLLFIGLWTLADREGRLEDRPRKIKMELFPADDCDVDSMLQQLADAGFIERYGASTVQTRCKHQAEYIQILKFGKHQNPHKHERASEIPAPDEIGRCTVQELCKDGSRRADSPSLIPDSCNTPHSPPSGGKEKTKPARGERLAADWTLPRDWREWTVTNTPAVDPDREADKFRDYWIGQAGAKARKTDWQATWRNWCRKAEEGLQSRTKPQPSRPAYRDLRDVMGLR
jgi:hypothetical protein